MKKNNIAAFMFFVIPALVTLLTFFFLPVFAAFLLSFTDFDIYSLGDLSNLRFTGFANYLDLFEDPLFWKSLTNTFYFVFAGAPLSILVSLSAALLVNSKLIKWKSTFRVVYFLPVITTLVAVAIVWRYIYHPRFGLFNYFLSFLGLEGMDWLGNPVLAMPSIIILAIWKNFGYNMIIFIAGLQNIPSELYEAADIEGANWWQKFRDVTLPLLAPTTIFITIITMIGYFQLFAEPYIMTQGGPLNSTLSVVLYMYNEGFKWWNIGYATAIAFSLFIIIMTGTLIQLAIQRKLDR
ncbi:MAG: sugar ABC transporter permease [Ignavibacteriaceae bacterium]|nr:sugar ABC transporter permease [Ignavibacteriaceae bacterium]